MKNYILSKFIRTLQTYVSRPWYPPLLGLLAALDHLIIIIPTDGLLVTSILAAPKRWLSFVLWLTLGSVLGGTLLATFIQTYETPFLEWVSPGIHLTEYWKLTDSWVEEYGLWALFTIAALPIFQHPVIAITALAGLPLYQIALFMLGGRIIKYGVFGWLASHAPQALLRMKSVRKELEEIVVTNTSPPKTESIPPLLIGKVKR